MNRNRIPVMLILLSAIMLASCGALKKGPVIIISKDASALEELAAKEVRRYFYLRTGRLLPLELRSNAAAVRCDAIVILEREHFLAADFTDSELKAKVESLGTEEYVLKTFPHRRRTVLLVAGGGGTGTLYGAYRLAEKLGVRFYLHGDVVPDAQLPVGLPAVDEVGRPLFRLRGIHPFHDFPEGPDWWNAEEYKAILGQLPKLRMNFFGLHTYPEGHPNAEPTVWIGLPEDSGPDGTVSFSYPSSYQNTLRGNWGYEATGTGDFHFGASELFESDGFGPEVMQEALPEPKTAEEANTVFNSTGAMLRDAFTFGRSLGIKTCVGTEMPLTIPELVKKRLLEKGLDPRDPAVVEEVYKGLFSRIRKAYPLDYYWLWTDENWTWSDADEKTVRGVVDDARLALAAAADIQSPFALATCGWVLGPPSGRTLFDHVLPKEVAVSCINREVGKAPVDPMFARIDSRSKWAIPWLEDDPALTSPQLWAGRMRKDAVDALAYGCDGLLGIHWRTRALAPNIGALAAAAWEQGAWSKSLSPIQEEGPVNGVYVSFPEKAVAQTRDQPVYQDIRDRVFGYNLNVPNGTYDIVLKFREGEIREKGRRVFDISLEGKKVAEKVDIFGRVGADRALDLRFRNISVEDGRLEIDFADRIHYPAIAAIVVEGEGFSKKINCGGGDFGDYEADWPETPRHAPVLDFYEDWAAHEFGSEVAVEAAAVLARIDGHLPQLNVWTGPGGIRPDPRPWEEAREDFAFVDELAALDPRITGKGNASRFAYWLASFFYMKEMAHLECLWAEYNATAEALKAMADGKTRAEAAARTLLPIRERMVGSLKDLYSFLLATVSNTGELGTVANWEQHLLPALMHRPGEELRKLVGSDLLSAAEIPRTYNGPPRVIVPTVRTALLSGEPLDLKVIILASEKPVEATFHWRELGKGAYAMAPLEHVARGIYRVSCAQTGKDTEYYVKVRVNNEELYFPATAPLLGQTVLRMR
ncbi:MAG: malectin domain-containing carbohydrate-binding protein [Candidatus Aminicenantales bacterium]